MSRRDWCSLVSLLVLAALPLGSHAQTSNSRAEAAPEFVAAPDDPPDEPIDSDLLEQLSAIGYVSGSVPAGPLKGVTTYDDAQTYPGLNFYVSAHRPGAAVSRRTLGRR